MSLDMSGSTGTVVYIEDNQLSVASLGDSRAIICLGDKINENPKFIQLNIEHLPTIEEEKTRIIDSGGEIRKISIKKVKSSKIPLRIYKKGLDQPGLMMTRSFGDILGKECGIINDPYLKSFSIDNNCKALILASDGVWEQLSNEEVTSIVNDMITNSNSAKQIINKIVNLAIVRWKSVSD